MVFASQTQVCVVQYVVLMSHMRLKVFPVSETHALEQHTPDLRRNQPRSPSQRPQHPIRTPLYRGSFCPVSYRTTAQYGPDVPRGTFGHSSVITRDTQYTLTRSCAASLPFDRRVKAFNMLCATSGEKTLVHKTLTYWWWQSGRNFPNPLRLDF